MAKPQLLALESLILSCQPLHSYGKWEVHQIPTLGINEARTKSIAKPWVISVNIDNISYLLSARNPDLNRESFLIFFQEQEAQLFLEKVNQLCSSSYAYAHYAQK